ncbi:MAG: trypsin-like peptidase domain-containing protein [Deltaproteobacteria bacterium]|nr:trypsin-like peptidase domain-containing protein [Deltaproteobacteria bacterium]
MRRLVVLAVVVAACREVDAPEPTPQQFAAVAQETSTMHPPVPGSFVDLVKERRHGVVGIRAAAEVKSGPAAMFPGAPDATADVALGTGFLIEAKGLFVITNAHIADVTPDLRVILPDRSEVPAQILGRDPRLDIALLKIDAPRQKALPLGDSDDVKVGEWIIVLGNPFGDEVTASAGIVSATGREGAGSYVIKGPRVHRTFLQTDARIHRGNSGGPVLNTARQVIGVALATEDKLSELSFIVPINRVREIVDDLREHGQVTRGYLGAMVLPVTPERAQALGMPRLAGALVTEIKAGSPAARSALRVGDILLQWDGKDIDHRSLPWTVAQTPVGRPTKVKVWRNRAEGELVVVTEKMPE